MMRPGTYYVGDLCYVMHPQWKEVCNLMFATDGRGVLNGEFNLANGVRFAVSSTAYGDGTYFDRQDRQYPVDAGLIGCIRVEDVYDPEWYLEGVNVIEFDRPFQIVYNEGFIRFIDDYNTILVSIDTDPQEDDEEEEA
jgi:hypothetical protein